jgi:hypothetical protein
VPKRGYIRLGWALTPPQTAKLNNGTLLRIAKETDMRRSIGAGLLLAILGSSPGNAQFGEFSGITNGNVLAERFNAAFPAALAATSLARDCEGEAWNNVTRLYGAGLNSALRYSGPIAPDLRAAVAFLSVTAGDRALEARCFNRARGFFIRVAEDNPEPGLAHLREGGRVGWLIYGIANFSTRWRIGDEARHGLDPRTAIVGRRAVRRCR